MSIEAALFASRGLVTSVEPFLNRLSQREQLLRDFVPGSLGRYTYQGRLYALPFGVNTSFMVIYNPSLMARSGVTPPREGWNWADFLVLARKLTLDTNGDGQVDQWGFDSNRGYWLPWLINSRGRMFDRDTQTWFPDKAANREAFRFAVSLLREHQVMAPTAQGYGGLARQATVMFGDGNYAVSWMRTNDVSFPLQVVHWPVNGSRAIFVGGYGLFLGATSDRQRQEAAWTFISCLLEPAQQMKYVQVTGQIPSRLSAIRNAEYASQMSREPALAAFVNEVATYGVGQPIPVGYGDVLQMMFRWADRAYRGEVSPDAALEGLYDEINAYYKEVRVPLL